MNIKKCDSCGKILVDKRDDYFSIGSIDFHRATSKKDTIRLYLSSDKSEKGFDCNESWTSYADIHFCPECFKKENIEKYIRED